MIPFIYVGATKDCATEIERPIDIQVAADSFINRGGRYVMTVYSDGVVQLQAVVAGAAGLPHTIATQHVPHGPLVLGAIDRLVRESVRKLEGN